MRKEPSSIACPSMRASRSTAASVTRKYLASLPGPGQDDRGMGLQSLRAGSLRPVGGGFCARAALWKVAIFGDGE
jgi:hypothetical protein